MTEQSTTGSEPLTASDLSGIIVAGGESRRLGRPKAVAPLAGCTLLARIRKILAPLCTEVILAVRSAEGDAAASEGTALGMRVVTDRYSNSGPLAGIEAGLAVTQNDLAFVVGADQPFVSPALVVALRDLSIGRDGAVAEVDGRLQPLATVFNRRLLPAIGSRLDNGITSPIDMIREHIGEPTGFAVLPESTVRHVDPDVLSFFDIDTPEDLERAEATARANRG